MVKRREEAGWGGVPWGMIVVVVVLLVAVGVGVYWWWGRGGGTGVAQTQEGAVSGELVSDDRIIFGGIPRVRAGATNGGIRIEVLKNKAYMVGYSEERKDPLWSAYRVVRMEHPFVLERPKGDFLTDMRTSAEVAQRDFTDSGYDRGHMTPNSAIARCFGAEAQRETFLLSNICPQAKLLNREVWEKLERDEIGYANAFGEVWMVDGPVFRDVEAPGSAVTKLRSGIAVPMGFYKILVEDESGGRGTGVKAFAVIMPQGVKGTELPGQFVVSIKEVEEETGLEFLWKLDGKVREGLEGKVGPMWAVRE